METYEDPVGDGTRLRQITPFLIVCVLALALGALPPYGPAAAVRWAGAIGCFVLVAALMVWVPWYRLPVVMSLIPVAVYCVAVDLLRASSGQEGAEFGPLLIVPVVWTALYTTRPRMYLAIGAVFLALAGPIVVLGAPSFPATQWRDAVLFTAMASTVGIVVKRLTAARTDLVEQIRSMARTDPLTGLVNRRGWDEVLAHEVVRMTRRTAREPQLTVALLDLDHFKQYNDAHGHLAGDRFLAEVAEAWTGRLRRTDAIARWGGEEFAVLLPGTDLDQAVLLITDLMAVMPAGVTCSAGLSSTPGTDAPELLKVADQQLYRSKSAGRARISWVGGTTTVDAPPNEAT